MNPATLSQLSTVLQRLSSMRHCSRWGCCLSSFTAMHVEILLALFEHHNQLHSDEVEVHHSCGSSQLILALWCGDVVMVASSAHHTMCAPGSERHVCCFVIFPLLLRRSVSRSCSHTPVWRRILSFAFSFVSFIETNPRVQCAHSILHVQLDLACFECAVSLHPPPLCFQLGRLSALR